MGAQIQSRICASAKSVLSVGGNKCRVEATEAPVDSSSIHSGTVRNEARSRGLLWTGKVTEIYELSHRTAFLGRDRSRHLRRMAEGDSAARRDVALSSRSVLPVDVLVLRLSHLGRPARRADRRHTPRRCAAKSIWYRDRSVGASRSTISTSAAERRRSWRRDTFADLIGAIRHAFFVRSLRRDRGRDRPAHAYGRDGRCAGPWWRQPGEPRRAELRSDRPARHQSGTKFRARPLRR